jgi:hypothetical protein
MTTIKLKNGSGAPAGGDLVQGEPALDLTNKRLYTEDSGGTVIEVGTNPGTDVTFADNRKAIFGAGSDLQIYHDGSNSFINEAGTGDLSIKASNNLYLMSGSSELYAKFTTDGAATLYHNNAAKLATTSTGIDVSGSVTADALTVDSSGEFTLGTSSGGSALQLDVSATGTDGVDIKSAYYSGGYGPMKFHAGGSERMRIDSSGRLGIGTSSPTSLLHLSGTYPKITLNDETGVDRAFSVGTNNETFTIRNETGSADVLAITNANNVGIGTSSPAELFVLNKSSGDTFVRFDKSGTFKGLVGISDSSGSGSGSAVAGDVILRSQTRVLLDTGGTTRAVVDASGNVGIGTSSPSQALHVAGAGSMMLNESTSWSYLRLKSPSANGGYIQFADAEDDDVGQIFYYHGAGGNYMSFTTNASEAMRIDASGNLLVGTTSTANIANATPNVVTDQSYGINDTVNKVAFQVDRISFDSSNYYVLNSSAIGVKLVNGATAWTTQSDETLKENITELTNVLSKVQNLRCVSYNLKSQNSDDVKLGFIAQDWQTDFSQVVNVDPCDGKLGMNYTETIPVLLKAIQEQTEIINDLRARVAQLEGEA